MVPKAPYGKSPWEDTQLMESDWYARVNTDYDSDMHLCEIHYLAISVRRWQGNSRRQPVPHVCGCNWKAGSSIVERFVLDTTSAVVDDRRCCPETTSDARTSRFRWQTRWSHSMLTMERQHRLTVIDCLPCTQPAKNAQKRTSDKIWLTDREKFRKPV